MKSIILIAPPAAGKGTQSDMLVEKYGFAHISTGEMLREVASHNEDIKRQLDSGNLISDEVVFDLLRERLLQDDCKRGFILDGFPRNVNQAIKYDELVSHLNVTSNLVIYLDVDKETACKRIVGRLTCPKCKKVYNEFIEDAKPIVSGICDDCNVSLDKRSDDNSETFSKRYDVYYSNTEPLIEYYEKKGILSKVDSGMGKDNVFNEIKNIVGDLDD